MDRRRRISSRGILRLETCLVCSCHDDCRRSRRHAPKRITQARRPSASSISRWLVRRLVRLQFCQRPYHRSDFALRAATFVSPATDEIEALAKINHSFGCDAGDAGWIQSHCSWRALSQRRHCGDISWRSLADDLCALVKADATPRGSASGYRGGRAAASDRGYSGGTCFSTSVCRGHRSAQVVALSCASRSGGFQAAEFKKRRSKDRRSCSIARLHRQLRPCHVVLTITLQALDENAR